MRFWGISSVYQRVDDIPGAKRIETIYHGGWRPDPVYFYPIFFNYIVALGLRGLSAFLTFVGVHEGPGLYPFRFEEILFVARFLSALLGSLTILLVYALGRKLYSRREGLLASFFFSVSFIHIVFSHQIVLDVPMTFFYTLALFLCARLLDRRGWPDYLLAGFVCGLAVATKYNGIFILAALFFAHVLGQPPGKKRFLRALAAGKLYGAGLASLIGFAVAHPYAVLRFRHFLRSSALLIRVVHETEYYLKPIQPKTGLEHIQYNKYFLALKNIFVAEGALFFFFIIAGIAWVLIRRTKSNAFVALSGLAYFLGALGFLGFSRYRDIPPLAVCYSFLAMLGWQALSRLVRWPPLKKSISFILLPLALVGLEYSSLTKTYYLWEDDTTEVAERWIRRNLPEGSFFGKEWFTPPTAGKDYSYPAFSAPFLFSRNFAPYDRFDFVITSSAAYGHFFRHQKFYPEVIKIYRNVRDNNELVKRFFFWDFEYKNPEVNIFAMGSPSRPRQRLGLPCVLPLDNPPREFEMADGSPYGKGTRSFFLRGGEEVTRILVSPRKIRQVAVFATALEGRGKISIRNFPTKKTLALKRGEVAHGLWRPRRSFPFYKYVYKITVRAPRSLRKAVVKLCYDDFDTGREFFDLEDYRRAREFFLQALSQPPRNFFDLELYLYLERCARKLGLSEEAREFRQKAMASPFFRRYLSLFQTYDSQEAWIPAFEKLSGLNFKLLEQTLTTTIDDAAFRLKNGVRIRDERFFRGWASILAGMTGASSKRPEKEEAEGENGQWFEASSPEIETLPQDYRLEFIFVNAGAGRGTIGEVEIASTSGGKTERAIFPLTIEPTERKDEARAVFLGSAACPGQIYQFIVRVKEGQSLALDCLKIVPDIRAFFNRKVGLVQEFLEGMESRPKDGQE